MDRLEEYLSGEFRADKQQIRDVEETLKAACNTLSVTFDKQNAWPYQVNEGQGTVTPTDISHSTTAMVAAALARTTGLLMPRATRARLFRWPLDIFAAEARSELVDTVKSALGLLMGQSGILDKTNQIHTTSGTFGDDDVLTLSCLFDLAQSNVVPEFQRTLRLAAKKPRDRLVGVDPTEPEKLLRHADSDTMENAFLHLRAVQCVREADSLLGAQPLTALDKYRAFFEARLHQHLSYSAIPDSRFDPAELCFSLEGLLQVQPKAVDRSLIIRAIEVLGNVQTENAYWRPTKPILATNLEAHGLLLKSFSNGASITQSILGVTYRRTHEAKSSYTG